ncbi:MAG: WXG100 family type VII secretion target [Mycolicibacterium cosmeticum]|nr:WXG100 family type VII secretion target [Mycolicibacterium cosmeticum]
MAGGTIPLDGLIAALATFSGDIDAQLDELEQRVDGLHVQWSGDAAGAHAKAHAEWEQGALLMAEDVRRLHQASTNAHSAFRSITEANRALFS